MGGFSVDLRALEEAAQGVNATLEQVSSGKVSDYNGDGSAFGDDDLAGTVADFSDRWQIGVQHLAKDAQAIAAQLTYSVAAYRKVDQESHAQFAGILRGLGTDPAAG
jgi:hypothetical protein